MFLPPRFPDVPFTWPQAKALGISRHRLDQAVANRNIRRVLRGVYQRADLPNLIENRALAAALVVSCFGIITDRTAAWLHGVDTFEYRDLEILPPLEIFVLRDRNRITRRGCAGGERDLLPCDLCLVNGVRVTTPVRTALDLACTLSRRGGLAALDAFMRVCGVTKAEMYGMMPRYFRRRGVIQLRQLVPLADPRSESPGESWTRMDIIDAGLPVPELQHWVYDAGQPVYRLDLAYPKSKVCVEYDGREFHEGEDHQEHDRRRREWLVRHGWTVIVVTKDSFAADAQTAWIAVLRDALRVAA